MKTKTEKNLKNFLCKRCKESFSELVLLKHHEQNKHGIKIYHCQRCDKYFTFGTNFYRHVRCFHSADLADQGMETPAKTLKSIQLSSEQTECHGTRKRKNQEQYGISSEGSKEKTEQCKILSDKFKLVETAFKNRLVTYKLKNRNNIHDPLQYLELNRESVIKLLREQISLNRSIKVNMVFNCTHINVVGEHQIRTFKTRNKPLFQETDLEKYITRSNDKLNKEMTEHAAKQSGWTVYSVNDLEIRINKYTPLAGHRFIPLPKQIALREAVINVQNKDNECFKYAVLAKYLHGSNLRRESKYKNLKHPYDFSSVTFPTALTDIPVFEKRNKMSINVFSLDKNEKVYPIKVVEKELNDHVDLLFLRDEYENSHYCYIKNFEKLVAIQLQKDGHKLLICKKCFQHYYIRNNGERKMREHKRLCNQQKTTRVDMPKNEDIFLKFKNTAYETEMPITICADFESVLVPVLGCQNNPELPGAQVTHMHKLMSYCFFVKHSLPSHVVKGLPTQPVLYRARNETDDVGAHFMEEIQNLAKTVSNVYKRNEPMMELNAVEKNMHNSAEKCNYCKRNFTKKNCKTRDHDHLTGRYRQPLCNTCNLKNRKQMVLPIIFHNLTDYDAHHLIRKLGCVKGEIQVIPTTEEKFISFTKKIYNISCRFLDSYRFLSESLSKLADYLPQDKFLETKKYFRDRNIELVTKKCLFPYEYVDSLEKLNEKTLPSIEKFYSSLSESCITVDEYSHCKKVWDTFDVKSIGEFSDLYLTIDCLLLTDIFYNFRQVCLKHYKLDPAYYYTTPALSWDAMLKKTGVQFELLSDYDLFMTVENGIRGGLAQCTTRHAVANNPYLPSYDPDEEASYIMYKDANNLYAAAMCEPLPYGGFEILDQIPTIEDILTLDDEGPHGYLFVVDIKYPKYLHNKHIYLPFLPECVRPPGSKLKKLMATVNDKEYYVVHYRALKQAMQHGLLVQKIHNVIKFKQSRWMKKYIDLNTALRKNAENNFEEAFFKYMNNAVYGKCMEQIRNRMNMKLVSSLKQLRKCLKKATFLDRTIYEENLAAVHFSKEFVVMNKPIFVGQAVLDLSKVIMYKFYYSVMKRIYGNKLTLLYMDTDSFIMKIICNDFYRDMTKLLKYFDTSNYPQNHPCFSMQNKKVLAKFKDEMAGKIIAEFCGIRAKAYAIRLLDLVLKRLKGVKKYALRSKIHFDDYLNCLRDTRKILYTSYYSILSRKHKLTTNKFTKVALSAFDDKRYIRQCGIKTLPWGHYHIPKLEEIRIRGHK